MPHYQRILFPVDLSKTSLSALSLATNFAKQHSAKLVFVHVAPDLFPEEAMYGADYVRSHDRATRSAIEALKPLDSSVEYDHSYLHGNAGPEIVDFCQENDFVVMSTHGKGAIARFVMGSVAQYVLRHAKCPVIIARGLNEPITEETIVEKHFVTEIMDHVPPVQKFNNILEIAQQLNATGKTAAPVVDVNGKCAGILTTADIDNFKSLKKRYEAKDIPVLDEMFEVDKYGMRQSHSDNFDYVERHMTSEVISISNSGTIQEAISVFQSNPNIHHLIVVDSKDRPVGMIDSVRAFTFVENGQMLKESSKDVVEKGELE